MTLSRSNAAFASGPSSAVMAELEQEVASEFADFAESLISDEARRQLLMQQLVDARIELASVRPRELLPTGVTDWEYLLENAAEVLSDEELQSMRDHMAAVQRQDVIEHFGPQLELSSPSLTSDNQSMILEQLSNELLLTPGSQAGERGVLGHLQRQITALETTQIELATALPADQLAAANSFFDEQLLALQEAQSLFGRLFPTP